MPLISTVLDSALEQAFDKAMLVFAETIKNSPVGTDVGDQARQAAAKTFSSIAAPAIDSYIKSATIIVPPGQVVATAGSPAAQTGATTAPSPPAQIS
jgi:hypothetical protein